MTVASSLRRDRRMTEIALQKDCKLLEFVKDIVDDGAAEVAVTNRWLNLVLT